MTDILVIEQKKMSNSCHCYQILDIFCVFSKSTGYKTEITHLMTSVKYKILKCQIWYISGIPYLWWQDRIMGIWQKRSLQDISVNTCYISYFFYKYNRIWWKLGNWTENVKYTMNSVKYQLKWQKNRDGKASSTECNFFQKIPYFIE
jgi:hypothetical protein